MKYSAENGIRKSSTVNSIFAGLGLLIGSIAVCFLLMVAVYAIPTSLIADNVQESAKILQTEELYPTAYVSGKSMDNFTEAVILEEAVLSGNDVFTSAMENNYWCGNYSPIENLQLGLSGSEQVSTASYSRYWHGYLVLIKPLLLFMNLRSIRILFQGLFIVALGLFAVLAARRLPKIGPFMGGASIIAFTALGCLEAAACLPLFFSFFISVVAMIIMLFVDLTNTRRIAFAFMIIGTCTVFFDFLDNPILTLGLPLAVLIVREWSSPSFSFRENMKRFFIFCLLWVVGYVFVWAGKWILATLVLGDNVIENAINEIFFWSSANTDESVSGLEVISQNIFQINTLWLIACGMILIAGIVLFTWTRVQNKHTAKSNVYYFYLLVVALFPVIWMLAFSGHSSQHSFFVYRDLVITVFCLLCTASMAFVEWKARKTNPINNAAPRDIK